MDMPMAINEKKLKNALSTVHQDERGNVYSAGKFVDLVADLQAAIALDENKLKLLGETYRQIGFIRQDFLNIGTILDRLNWQKSLYAQNNLDTGLWMRFASCDAEFFHIEFRSIFDHLAEVIKQGSKHPDNVPQSFNRLKKWINKDENNVQIIGDDLANFIRSCDYFDDLR
ncbi:MAG: hypothetical protein ACXQT3_02735, partial [Methermicoccaceae archaeon]